jgi:hypothetical protein
MDSLLELGMDGEIFDDGTIHTPFPTDIELDLADPLDG